MFAKERHQKIVSKLNKTGRVLVKDLAMEFDVSEDCIRKDLTILQKQNLLEKAYGGAIRVSTNRHLHGSSQRKELPDHERVAIAKKAIKTIEARDTLFLDISLTNVEIAKEIINRNIKVTVITNMIEILNILAPCNNVTLIFVGGQINEERDGFNDTLASSTVKNFVIDKSYIGLTGVDVFSNQVSTYRIDDGLFKKQIIANSKKSFLLVENRKFHEYGNFVFADLREIDFLLVSELPEKEFYEQLEKSNIELM